MSEEGLRFEFEFEFEFMNVTYDTTPVSVCVLMFCSNFGHVRAFRCFSVLLFLKLARKTAPSKNIKLK